LLLICAILFTITTIYWYLNHSEDFTGIIIFAIVAILSYLGGIGNLISGK
jgi:hypothetical protein